MSKPEIAFAVYLFSLRGSIPAEPNRFSSNLKPGSLKTFIKFETREFKNFHIQISAKYHTTLDT